MTFTGVVNAANARIDFTLDWTTIAGVQTASTVYRRVGAVDAPNEYVRAQFGTALLGEQSVFSDHEAPLDVQLWYIAAADNTGGVTQTAGPFTIPSNGYVWIKDPGRPWADLRLDLCQTPTRSSVVCAPTPLIRDTFSRTVVDGWGSADSGQAWTNSGGAAADFDVAAGVGTHTHPATNTAHRSVIAASTVAQEVLVDVSVSQLAAGDNSFAGPVLRHADSNNYYWARGTFTPSGTVQMAIRKRLAGTETGIGPVVTLPFGYTAGQMFRIRFQIIGSTLRARIWPADQAETQTWTVQVNDFDLAAAGSVGVRTLVNSAATNVNQVFSFDNFAYSDPTPVTPNDIAWVGFGDKTRAMDAGLFDVLDKERRADVYARRKDIITSAQFLTRTLGAIDLVYELFTAGGPVLIQLPAVYGQPDRYYQPGDLAETYLSQDQRKPWRLWRVPLTTVDTPIGLPQGTDTANWCAIKDLYSTFADLTATGYSWGQVGQGQAASAPLLGLYGGGTYGGGLYGG